jgi:hypothetical protein
LSSPFCFVHAPPDSARQASFRHNGGPPPRIIRTMLNSQFRPPRPQLTGRIALFALVDVFGLSSAAIGASWFVAERGAIIEGFPASMAEAVACTAGGVVVMFWAVTRILRELRKQTPEMQAKYASWIATHHPDKVCPPPPPGDGD